MESIELQRRALTVADFCRFYSIGRTTTYALIKAGTLPIVKVGKRTLIPVAAAESWFASLGSSDQGQTSEHYGSVEA